MNTRPDDEDLVGITDPDEVCVPRVRCRAVATGVNSPIVESGVARVGDRLGVVRADGRPGPSDTCAGIDMPCKVGQPHDESAPIGPIFRELRKLDFEPGDVIVGRLVARVPSRPPRPEALAALRELTVGGGESRPLRESPGPLLQLLTPGTVRAPRTRAAVAGLSERCEEALDHRLASGHRPRKTR